LGKRFGDVIRRIAMALALDEWISEFVPSFQGQGLDSVGPATRMLRDTIRSERRTAATVASAFWQSYVHSGALASALQAEKLEPTAVFKNEILVVAHGAEQFTLLLMHPALDPGAVHQFQAMATRGSLESGWATISKKRDPRELKILGEVPSAVMERAALEANSAREFSVVVTGPVPEEATSLVRPPLNVDTGGVVSTAGAWVQDGAHRVGVTAAYHAVRKGAVITVGNAPATHIAGDALTDSCFLEVPHARANSATSHGPLKVAPRSNEIVNFSGWVSGGQTRVVAFNYELPYIDPNLQQTIRTEQVTSQGDSGAALVDSNDYILGFAHSRSAPNAPFAYSSWIWADAVYQKLGLIPY
jgi:hypothetical protein